MTADRVGSGSTEVPGPPMDARGFHREPTFYPIVMRRVADLIEALTAFDKPDPAGQESPHFVASATLAIFNEEQLADDDPTAGLIGWVVQEDTATWVFIPRMEAS